MTIYITHTKQHLFADPFESLPISCIADQTFSLDMHVAKEGYITIARAWDNDKARLNKGTHAVLELAFNSVIFNLFFFVSWHTDKSAQIVKAHHQFLDY